MVERNTFVETVNDGDQINEGYFNGIFDVTIKSILQDQTAGTVSGTTNETEIGEVQIPANEVDSGVLVFATGTGKEFNNNNSTIKLYGGTSATATNNTLFKTITRNFPNIGNKVGAWAIVYWVTGLTWSSVNFINITGTNSQNNANAQTTCESIVCVTI